MENQEINNLQLEVIKNGDISILMKYWDEFVISFWDYLPRIVIAILVLFIGFFIVKYIERAIAAFFEKTNFDEALERFIQSLIIILLKILIFGLALLVLGAKLGAFAAAFGAMVFAVGMALQGSLSNFAGGVLILFFKPFKIGDYITSEGFSGKVTDIQIFNTILETPDGKKIILPNGQVSNKTIINHTDIKFRRLDLIIGIDYKDDIEKAKEILEKIIKEEKRFVKEKDSKVAVNDLGESAVEILFRAWTTNNDFWSTRYDILEKIKKEFDKNNISFPFPQRDIHVYNEK